MRFRVFGIALLLFLLVIVAACTFPMAGKNAEPVVYTPTTLYLVTANENAAATPTPFQPGDPINTPDAQMAQPTPAATVDPNIALPANATPQSFYIPPYAPEPAAVLTDNQTVTFALLGSDKRPGDTYFRTDTIVIAAIRPDSGQVTLVSIPRDLWVYVPNVGMDRINAAYEYGIMYDYPGGGDALLKDTILYNLGIRIDHLAIIDFDGFRKVVDTLGGLDVPVFCPYTDWHLIDPSMNAEDENSWSLYTVGPGVVHMNGDLALWYARSRKKSSDFDRGRRSQEVLRALYARATQVNALTKVPELYNDFSSSVITDLNLDGVLKLSPLALHLNNADIRSYYIGKDMVTGWMTPGGAQVLLPNGPAIQSMLQQAFSPSVKAEQEKSILIEIRNGTGNPGWAELAAQRLNYAGYNTRIASADRADYATSLLYDLTASPDLNKAASLLAILGLPNTDYVTMPAEDSASYVLILGQDYQPCFNPANLAP